MNQPGQDWVPAASPSRLAEGNLPDFVRFRRFARLIAFVIVISGHATCFSLTVVAPAEPDFNACTYSDSLYANDAMLMRLPKTPSHFRLMVSRYVEMVQAKRGYDCTGTVTVGFDGHHYLQTGRSDDPGIMELIPTLSRWIRLPLLSTYDLTISITIAAGLAVGYAGFCKLYPCARMRWIGAVTLLCIGLAEVRVADEYIFQISPLIAGIPWLLHFAFTRKPFLLIMSASALAFCCSWCSLMRTGTSVVCMTFLLSMFLFRCRVQRPLVPLVLFVLVSVPPAVFEKSLIDRQNVALLRVDERPTAQDSRPFWHTFYIGLGFIHNSEVSEYRDEVARDKVRSIDPTVAYTSEPYEKILRQEVWRLLKRKPMLVIGIFAAKISIVMLVGLILLYPARRLMFVERELMWLDVAFILTIGVSAVNSIVAVPRLSYLLTFCCLALMYSTVKVCSARRTSIPR